MTDCFLQVVASSHVTTKYQPAGDIFGDQAIPQPPGSETLDAIPTGNGVTSTSGTPPRMYSRTRHLRSLTELPQSLMGVQVPTIPGINFAWAGASPIPWVCPPPAAVIVSVSTSWTGRRKNARLGRRACTRARLLLLLDAQQYERARACVVVDEGLHIPTVRWLPYAVHNGGLRRPCICLRVHRICGQVL